MKYLFFFALLLLAACQIPLDNYDQENQQQFVKIEAEITPHYARVAINKTSKNLVGNTRIELLTVPQELYIEDGQGNKYFLPLDGSADSTFQGIVGETYTLHTSVGGKDYESLPEKILPVPPIDTLQYAFSTIQDRPEGDLQKHGFDVNLWFEDLPETGNYYQWIWINYSKRYRCGTSLLRDILYNLPCECDCWDINFNPDIILFSDNTNNGGPHNIPILRVPHQVPPNKYYLKVDQRAISKHVYDYYLSAQAQTQSTGGQFDVPAQTQFSTNIFCTTDTKEKVLGVFNCFNYDQKLIYVDRGVNIPGIPPKTDAEYARPQYQCSFPFPPPCKLPCVETKFATKIKPANWQE